MHIWVYIRDCKPDYFVEIHEKTRYDYNLTIMESPKLATDNSFKK
jgi:hypothetical protein